MNRRLILTVGAAAGGLLAAAFLQSAVAFADDDATFPDVPGKDAFTFGNYTWDPFTLGDDDTQTEGFATIDPVFSAPPFLSIGGSGFNDVSQDFDIFGGDDGTTLQGTASTDVNVLNLFGMINTEYTVTGTDGADGVEDPSLPAEGSVYDVFNFGNGFMNVYTAIPGAEEGDPAKITDILATPFGNFDLGDLFGDFDATSPLDPGDAFGIGADIGADTGADAGDTAASDPFAFLGL